jgi:hypothetical protein
MKLKIKKSEKYPGNIAIIGQRRRVGKWKRNLTKIGK